MHLRLNAVACAMRTKNSGVQDRRARSARYPECANVMHFDLGVATLRRPCHETLLSSGFVLAGRQAFSGYRRRRSASM